MKAWRGNQGSRCFNIFAMKYHLHHINCKRLKELFYMNHLPSSEALPLSEVFAPEKGGPVRDCLSLKPSWQNNLCLLSWPVHLLTERSKSSATLNIFIAVGHLVPCPLPVALRFSHRTLPLHSSWCLDPGACSPIMEAKGLLGGSFCSAFPLTNLIQKQSCDLSSEQSCDLSSANQILASLECWILAEWHQDWQEIRVCQCDQ